MNKINSVVYKLLLKIKKELPAILKDNLYGIYVYGSLTYGSFRPKSSDIDCLAVTNKPLNNNEIKLLKSWYDKLLKQNRAAKRLEMSYGVKSNLNSTRVTKTPKFFGQKFYKRSDSDANNPIIWLNLKNSGITLFGPDPKKFAPKITNEILKQALKTESNYIKKRPNKFLKEDRSKAYVVLTFCRIIYTLKTKEITSKTAAAKWCFNNLPKKYHPIISSALKSLTAAVSWKLPCHPRHKINEESRSEIYNLGKYISTQLNKN